MTDGGTSMTEEDSERYFQLLKVRHHVNDKDVPVIPNLDAVMLRTLINHAKADTNGLYMGSWHGQVPDRESIPGETVWSSPDETNWCKTTHCRAGYAVCLAGPAGWKLERLVDVEAAGALIYIKSTGTLPTFYGDTKEALLEIVHAAIRQGFKAKPGDIAVLADRYHIARSVLRAVFNQEAGDGA